MSEQFFCNRTNLLSNPYPERCGVPFSCCRRTQVQVENAPSADGGSSSSDSLLSAIRSLQCWQNAQTKRPQELESDLYVRGCIGPLRATFENHVILIGTTIALAFLPAVSENFFQRRSLQIDLRLFFRLYTCLCNMYSRDKSNINTFYSIEKLVATSGVVSANNRRSDKNWKRAAALNAMSGRRAERR